MNQTLCFTGHRNLPKGDTLDKLKVNIENELNIAINDGYNTFLNGMCQGFDLLVLEILVNKILPNNQNIKIVAVVPYKDQSLSFDVKTQVFYNYLINKSTDIVILSEKYSKNCYRKRNEYLVENSSKIIAFYNGSKRSGTQMTLNLARKNELEIKNLYKKQ